MWENFEDVIRAIGNVIWVVVLIWLWGKYVVPSKLYKKLHDPRGKKKTPEVTSDDNTTPDPKNWNE